MARACTLALLTAVLCTAANAQLPGGLGSGVSTSELGGAGSLGGVSTTGVGTGVAQQKEGQHFFTMPGDGTDPGIIMHEDVRVDVGKPSGNPVSVTIAEVTKPKGFVQMFTTQEPHNATQRVAVQSQRKKCTLAMNNGAWSWIKPGTKGYRMVTINYPDWVYPRSICSGQAVVEGRVVCTSSSQRVGYGVTQDDRWAWGKFTDAEVAAFKFFRTGHAVGGEFLVDNYEIRELCESETVGGCGGDSARSGVCLTATNGLMLVTLDGSSGDFDNDEAGCTLDQFARLMGQLGCKYAINMDGGGSSTMVATRSFTSLSGMPSVDILNDPSDCRSMGAQAVGAYDVSDIEEEPWYVQTALSLAEFGPKGACARKVSGMVCIGDDSETHTVPKKGAGKVLNGCGHEILEEHMVGEQLNFCKNAYQNIVEHSFDTDAREAYEDALSIVADYKANLYLACQQQSVAPYYMPKRESSCAGQNDVDDAFWHIAMTALLARRVMHENSLGGRQGAGAYAQQYMDAGEDPLVTGWNVSDVKACAGDKSTCVSAATNTVNHAVGARVWEEAWGPYQKCRQVWKWRNGRIRRVTVCKDRYFRPSPEKLARRAFLEVCNGWKKGRLADMTVANNFNANTWYAGRAYFRFGSKPALLLCQQVRSLEDQSDAQLAGSIGGSEMDPAVTGFAVGMVAVCVGAAVGARVYFRRRSAAKPAREQQRGQELPTSSSPERRDSDKTSVNPIYAP